MSEGETEALHLFKGGDDMVFESDQVTRGTSPASDERNFRWGKRESRWPPAF